MADQRRIGIVGIGFGVKVHVPGFRSEGWDVVAVSSRDEERARAAATAAGIPEFHTDAFELIGRDDLDAVAITTPPGPHHALVTAALESGKHVLCEKPFAVGAAQAIEMRDLAERNGRTAMIAHEFRYNAQRLGIKALLDAGHVGEFRMCTVEMAFDRWLTQEPPVRFWRHSAAEGGGLLGALGSHFIDGLRHWFGEAAEVSGRLASVHPDVIDPSTGAVTASETDDGFVFTVAFRDGGHATMTAIPARTPPGAAPVRFRIVGTDGSIYAEQPGANPVQEGTVLAASGTGPLEEVPPARDPLTDERDIRLAPFRLLVRDFTRGIETGTSPSPNFTDGVRCEQIIDAVRESSASGHRIRLPT